MLNDLYVISTRDFSTTLLQTGGDVPGPRYGHCVVLTSTILLIWGGSTNLKVKKNHLNQDLDDSLYLLNLGTSHLLLSRPLQLIRISCVPVSREWTRILVIGPGPRGRFYHSMTLVGSKLFVFGGRTAKRRLDDIWALDLKSCTFSPRFSKPF